MPTEDKNIGLDNYEKFTQLYTLYSQVLIGLATAIVKSIDIAEDLVHDVYEYI